MIWEEAEEGSEGEGGDRRRDQMERDMKSVVQ